jgi:hypothetical protein
MDSRQGSVDTEDPDSNLARDRAACTHHNKAWERHHKTFLQRLQASYLVDDLIEQSGAAHAHTAAAAPHTPADREPKTRGGSLFSKAALHEDTLSSAFSSAVNIAALGLESPTAECDTVDELAPLGFCTAPLNGAHRSSFAPGLRSNSEGTPQFNAPKLSKLLRLSFTEAHNTSHPDVVNDSSSAFLGEELSVHGPSAFFGALFAGHQRTQVPVLPQPAAAAAVPVETGPKTELVTEPANEPAVMLPLVSCGAWGSSSDSSCGAQHWIVPAVIAGFPAELLPLALQSAPRVPLCVTNSSSIISSSGDCDSSNSYSSDSNSSSGSAAAVDWFQCHELGSALVTRCDNSSKSSSSSSEPVQRRLLLRQNCLFEYAADHYADTDAPIGYVNLSKATVRYDAAAQPLVVHVAALETPVQSSTTVQLVLQASTAAAAQQWAAVLQQAAVLCMESLYELVASKGEKGADGGCDDPVLDRDGNGFTDSDLEVIYTIVYLLYD